MKGLLSWQMLPGGVLALVAAMFAATGPRGGQGLDAALAGAGVILVWGIAVAMRLRYPERRIGILLMALAIAYAINPLIYSTNDLFYTLGRVSRPGTEVLLIWVMLAFPSGRLEGVRERILLGAAVAIVLCLWLPGVMFSPSVPAYAPFARCVGNCPENLLFVADRPEWSGGLLKAFRISATGVLAATCTHLLWRLTNATALMRRTLYPVLLASLARTISVAVFLSTGAGLLALTFTLWAIPLAIALGLLRGRLYMAEALHRLVAGVRQRPGIRHLRDVIAEAVEDDSLELGVWDDARQCWVDHADRELTVPLPGSGERAARPVVERNGRPVAIIVHDRALLDEPTLLEAIAGAIAGVLAGLQTASALATERAHSATVAEDERRRIERDLHDGAQQRLLVLRLKIGVAKRLVENDPVRARDLLTEIGADADAAIVELRALAHGIVPPLLAERGLAIALAEAARCAALPVTTDVKEIGRGDPGIERAVYFCCVEAMQNAAKHAGPDARAALALYREEGKLCFAVTDSGEEARELPGFGSGHGMSNMRDRIEAVGGRIEVTRSTGGGVCISGRVPATGFP